MASAIDHLAVAVPDPAAAAELLTERLGISFSSGGQRCSSAQVGGRPATPRFHRSPHRGTAATICGPGITDTARSFAGSFFMRPSSVSPGHGSTFPSTISYSSFPSSTAASASIESGKRRLRGLVAFGCKKRIMTKSHFVK